MATVTEIMDHLRLLWARIGVPHCPECGNEVARRTVQEIVDDVLWKFSNHGIAVWSPSSGTEREPMRTCSKPWWNKDTSRSRVNGRDADFENPPELEKNLRHDIDVRIDRVRISRSNRQRLTEAIEIALRLGGGTVAIENIEAPADSECEYKEGR